jgi:hypothetical protein
MVVTSKKISFFSFFPFKFLFVPLATEVPIYVGKQNAPVALPDEIDDRL